MISVGSRFYGKISVLIYGRTVANDDREVEMINTHLVGGVFFPTLFTMKICQLCFGSVVYDSNGQKSLVIYGNNFVMRTIVEFVMYI